MSIFHLQINKITNLRSKSLILKGFLSLIFESICRIRPFKRLRRPYADAYPQSYPQFMWMRGWAIITPHTIFWSVGFVHHHTSGWLADLAPFDLFHCGFGLDH
jgi:hypothetical protein